MSARRRTRRALQRRRRFRRNCGRVCQRGIGIGGLTFAFTRIYLGLYGAHPAVVPRLGMTFTYLWVALVGVIGGMWLLLVLGEKLTGLWRRWVPRLGKEGW